MQQWCGLSETAMEKSPYEIASMKQFSGLFLGGSSISNKTTIFNFRHLRKANKPTEQIFALIHQHLLNKGPCLSLKEQMWMQPPLLHWAQRGMPPTPHLS